ncbi:MAG TPA: GerAB/ArcD/ProY family transporter [Clostridia bacterium]|nr:GerAB/ArcD/ProY family transporter [Clostridia bacterium]
MKTGKDKISVRQLLFVFTIIVSSPSTRFLPKYAAAQAAQAGWVSPAVSTVLFIPLILIIDSLLKKYEGQSMSGIITSIMGKYLGKLVLVIYLLWGVWLSAMYTRYYVDRLTSSIYPNISNNVLIILTLIPIAYMLRSGFTVIARMSEILLPFIGTMLVMLSIFLLGRIRTDNVLPIYFNDIMPIVKASFGSSSVLAYLFLLFFLSDKVVNLKSFKKFGYITTYVNISSMILVIFITIGVLGSSVAQRSPMPVLSTVKQVSLMDTIENIEAIIIAIWIFADFTLISTLFVVTLNLIKSIFKLSDTKPLINIYAILIYFLSLGICSNKFELEESANKLLVPLNIVLGYGFPIILFVLSKLKKGSKSSTKQTSPS